MSATRGLHSVLHGRVEGLDDLSALHVAMAAWAWLGCCVLLVRACETSGLSWRRRLKMWLGRRALAGWWGWPACRLASNRPWCHVYYFQFDFLILIPNATCQCNQPSALNPRDQITFAPALLYGIAGAPSSGQQASVRRQRVAALSPAQPGLRGAKHGVGVNIASSINKAPKATIDTKAYPEPSHLFSIPHLS